MPQTSCFCCLPMHVCLLPPWGFNVRHLYAQQHAFGSQQILTSMTCRHPPQPVSRSPVHASGWCTFIVSSGAWWVQAVSLAWDWDTSCMTVPEDREELILSLRETNWHDLLCENTRWYLCSCSQVGSSNGTILLTLLGWCLYLSILLFSCIFSFLVPMLAFFTSPFEYLSFSCLSLNSLILTPPPRACNSARGSWTAKTTCVCCTTLLFPRSGLRIQ